MKESSSLSAGDGVSRRLRWVTAVASAVLVSSLGISAAWGQGAAKDEVSSGPTASDKAAAGEATVVYRHARPANTAAGAGLKKKEIAAGLGSSTSTARSSAATATTADNDYLRFPGDLTYNGGAVVRVAEQHPVFLLPKNNARCASPSCWGNPEQFLRDQNIIEFIHITDQYVGATANNRYPVGGHKLISYSPTPKTAPLTDNDIVAFVHKVAAATGQTGYAHMYHVFLPPGQNECFTATDGVCYSPDVPDTFFFCGYHSSVDFQDIGHVLYSVEPFQDVPGCAVRPGTPNGQLADSTNNTLSHESIETITDPDGDAWFNFTNVVLVFQEIADECSFFVATPTATFFDPTVSVIGSHRYAVQPEYANNEHACASNP